MYHNNSDTKENTPYLSIKGVKGGRGQIYLGEIRKNSMEKMELDIGLEDWVAFFFSIIKEIHVYYRKFRNCRPKKSRMGFPWWSSG